jgi:hypothetical protein
VAQVATIAVLPKATVRLVKAMTVAQVAAVMKQVVVAAVLVRQAATAQHKAVTAAMVKAQRLRAHR